MTRVAVILTINGNEHFSPWVKQMADWQTYGRENLFVIIVDSSPINSKQLWNWAESYLHLPNTPIGECRNLAVEEGLRNYVSYFSFWKETYMYCSAYLKESISKIGLVPKGEFTSSEFILILVKIMLFLGG